MTAESLAELVNALAVGWSANEVAAVNAARIAGKPGSEAGALVARLEAARVVAE